MVSLNANSGVFLVVNIASQVRSMLFVLKRNVLSYVLSFFLLVHDGSCICIMNLVPNSNTLDE